MLGPPGLCSTPRTARRITYGRIAWYIKKKQLQCLGNPTSRYGKELHFAEFKLNKEKYTESTASGCLHSLLYLEAYHQQFENGFDLTPMGTDNLDLTEMGHWSP